MNGVVALFALFLHAGPPEAAVAQFQVADGFDVQLVAAEPLITQPVCIEFDDRGRLWVVQYRQYPNPAGLNRVKVDRYSRTEYDRLPEPPPKGPRGADRITILEDTDGDGRADRATDFLDGLNLASGIAFGHGGVFVLQAPYLLFYPDRDQNDVPDDDPVVLLTGFGMQDAHSVANSLTWGPDGWLYGCQGSTVTSRLVSGTLPSVPETFSPEIESVPVSQKRLGSELRPGDVEFQQGVWRYHPLTHAFDLFCEGGGNAWGLDFDADGRLFYSTNFGGHVLVHGVQGAYYVKSFGKHGALHNPYAYGYFEHATHQNFRGGHVTVGGIVYQGELFPPQFRGKYIAGDLLGHGVYWHDIAPDGSTFRTAHGGELLVSRDTWFAPSDVTQGPDGAVYVADWHDARTAHPDPDAEWDRSNGRVFRIVPKNAKPPASIGELHAKTSKELVGLLGSKNSWLVRRVRRILADRRDPEVIFPLRTLVETTANEQLALESLWALNVSGGFDESYAAKLLEHANPRIREWTARLLGDDGQAAPELAARLEAIATSESDVHVRSQLACSAKRWPSNVGFPIVHALLVRNLDANDPYLPLLCWWAIETRAVSDLERCRELFAAPKAFSHRIFNRQIGELLMRRWAAARTPETLRACAQLLAAAPGKDTKFRLVSAIERGLHDGASSSPDSNLGTLFASTAGVRLQRSESAPVKVSFPDELLTELNSLWSEASIHTDLVRLLAAQGNPAALDLMRMLIRNSSVDRRRRIELIEFVPQIVSLRGTLLWLKRLLTESEPEDVRLATIDVFARVGSDEAANTLLAMYPTAQGKLREKLRESFFSRRDWASQFLAAVENGKFPKNDVPIDQLRLLALHQNADLDAKVRQLWGSITRGTPEEKLAEMRRLNNDLRASDGDALHGRELFKKTCANCHQLAGDGTKLGPELTHANRQDREFLLASLVDPSAVVRAEYMNYVVVTRQGRVATGLIAQQTPSEVTLVNTKNERTAFRRDEIDQLQESPVSFMPENLLKPLSPQELRDLFAYLQSAPK